MIDRHPRLQDWLLIFLLALIWGSSFILMKEGLKAFSPEQVALIRISVTALVLTPFAVARRKDVSKKQVRTIMVYSMFGNFIPAFLFPAAQAHINSSTAGILNSLSPVWVLLLGMLFFNAPFRLVRLAGIVIAFGGAVWLMLYQPTHGSTAHIGYSFLIVVATLCYGLSANILKRFLHEISPLAITSTAFVIMLPITVTFLFLTDFIDVMKENPHAWSSLGFIAVLATFGTAIASVSFTRLVHRTSALFASSVTYLMPIVALGWGYVAGETISAVDFGAMALIFLGVYLISR